MKTIVIISLLTGLAVAATAQFRGRAPRTMEPVDLPPNQVSIKVKEDTRIIVANGIPDHETGQFPGRGNPHAIRPMPVRKVVNVRNRPSTELSRTASHRGYRRTAKAE